MIAAGRWPRALLVGAWLATVLVIGVAAGSWWQEWQATGATLGFPLDDAWIHMAFGRNLAWGLGFAAQPGEPSTASTSLLWSLWVGLLHAIFGGWGLAPVIWAVKGAGLAFALLAIWGAVGLLADELSARSAGSDLAREGDLGAVPASPATLARPHGSGLLGGPEPEGSPPPPTALSSDALATQEGSESGRGSGSGDGVDGWVLGMLPVLLVVVYPLGWAALSGMEVAATMAVCTWAWRWQRRGAREAHAGWARRGAVVLWAVASLLRPENLLLLVGMTVAAARREPGGFGVALVRLGSWAVPLIGGQALFYWALAGNPFPSTLAAKMTGRALPLAWEAGGWAAVAGSALRSPLHDLSELLGFLCLECPVFLILWGSWPFLGGNGKTASSGREEAGGALGRGLDTWLAWAALPVVVVVVGWVAGPEFQTLFHGRYLAHSLWLSAVTAAVGMAVAVARGRLPRLLVIGLVAGTAFGMWRQSEVAVEYGQEVDTINRLQVGWAQWFREHRPPGERLALHDVGAMAYFGRQRLIDLEGLITPRSMPWRRRGQVDRFLEQERPDFLLIFPYWYPEVLARLDVFRPLLKRSVAVNRTGGGEELVLFSMPWSPSPPAGGWPGGQPGVRFPTDVPDPRY